MFLPVLAIVDHESALKLAPLISIDREIDDVVGQALAFVSLVDPPLFNELAKQHKSSNGETLLSFTRLSQVMAEVTKLPSQLSNWPELVSAHMPSGKEKVKMGLLAVSNSETSEKRQEALSKVVGWIRDSPAARQDFYYDDLAVPVADWAASANDLTQNEIDALIFELMKRRPGKYETNGSLELLAVFSRLLAIRDAKLARKLLEPAFVNKSWLHTYQTGSDFERCFVLRSAAWIDPVWAASLTRELSDGLEIDDPVRRLSLTSGVVEELYTVGSKQVGK